MLGYFIPHFIYEAIPSPVILSCNDKIQSKYWVHLLLTNHILSKLPQGWDNGCSFFPSNKYGRNILSPQLLFAAEEANIKKYTEIVASELGSQTFCARAYKHEHFYTMGKDPCGSRTAPIFT